MADFLFHKRFTIFLVSFLITLFGNIFFPESMRDRVDTILILQNMFCSCLLFLRQPRKQQILLAILIVMAMITRFNQHYLQEANQLLFAGIYLAYFGVISYRIGAELSKQKAIGFETIAAVFCGFILLAVMASIIFISIDLPFEAFGGAIDKRNFSDFLYFSFVTLLTIGYGDITPTIELSRKLVVLFSLLGHFYTVFVTAIIIGKYITKSKGDK